MFAFIFLKCSKHRFPSTRSIFLLIIIQRIISTVSISHSSTCTHVLTHARNDYLEFPPSRVDSKLISFRHFTRLRNPSSAIFFRLEEKTWSLLLPYFFSLFFFFIQRIHRCGYTKLEWYHFVYMWIIPWVVWL